MGWLTGVGVGGSVGFFVGIGVGDGFGVIEGLGLGLGLDVSGVAVFSARTAVSFGCDALTAYIEAGIPDSRAPKTKANSRFLTEIFYSRL